MKKILFICAENAGRSQMAAAYFNYLNKDPDVIAESAGTIPAKQLHPEVIKVMAEDGIDIDAKKPKIFDPNTIEKYTRIISFGCLLKEAFSLDMQNRIEEWQIDDPRDQPLEIVRKIRDEIKKKVMGMISPNTGKLIIARHHESEWNKLGKWTGNRDVHLTPYGFEMSGKMGELIKDTHIDMAYASTQVRSFETLTYMLKAIDQPNVPIERSSAINERDYGDYTGKNKWEMKELFGEEKFNCIRRDWNCPVPNGETLKMVYERAVPYYLEKILPDVQTLKNVLVVSHGNAIRAMMKYIENISDENIKDVEMLFGSVVIYTVDSSGRMLTKEIRAIESKVNA